MYAPFPTLTAAGEADQFVADRIAEGADYLKIFSGVGGRWPALSSDTIAALATAAHARGLVVVAHVSTTAGVEEVVSAGVDVIAHVPAAAELPEALVDRIAEAGIAVGPTLATIENTLGCSGGAAVMADPRLADALGEAWARRLTSGAPSGRAMPPYSRAENNVRRLAQAGVTVLAGTDAPNPGTVFGASLHRELELLVRCGISPAQALAAATTEPARVFGLTDRGRVAVGQRADLVVVSGDPLADITETRAIERIWRAGTLCDRRAFVASAAEAEQLDAFDAQVARAVAAVRNRWNPQRQQTPRSTVDRL
jgi:imidazolonepropionase-like amidohydrolase